MSGDEESHIMYPTSQYLALTFFVIGLLVFLFRILLEICPPLLRYGRNKKAPDELLRTGDV